jgi:hypothetical protein
MTKASLELDCGIARQGPGRRFFDDARFIVILLAVIGFLTSGMIVGSFTMLNGKADKEYVDKSVAAVNEKIDNKFDTIIRLLQQHEENSRRDNK